MKGTIIASLAAGAHLGGPNLYFPVEQCIYRRKSEGVYIRNPKRSWEKLLSTAHATVATENPASVTVASSRNPRQRAVPLSWSAASLLEPPLTRPRQLPGAKTPVNFLPLVCVTQTLLCILETTHSRHKGAQSVGLMADAHSGRSVRARHRFLRTLERSRLITTSAHSEEMKRERQAAASSSDQGGTSR